jgi:PKD repeat protein
LGWNFFRWTGNASGSANPKVITIDGDKNITAVFLQDGYVLLVSTSGEGSVQREPWQDYFHYGDVVTLTATPEPGSWFVKWSGDLDSRANPATIIMTGSKTVMATFRTIQALTDVSFTVAPAEPKKNNPVTFTPSITPTDATQPIIYTWGFGDGTAHLITTTSSVAHTFGLTGTYTVWLTATNGYSAPVVYHREVIVANSDYFIYLPIIIRNP